MTTEEERKAAVEKVIRSSEAGGELSWEGMAGSIIDTVHLTPEDFVNEELVKHLKLYFAIDTNAELARKLLGSSH